MTVPAASGERPTPRTDLVVWLALIVALVGLSQTGTPPRVVVLAAIVAMGTLALSVRWRMGPVVVLVLLGIGVALRIVPSSGSSDVLLVVQAAAREMLAGGNPYGHGFDASIPPGAPFPYGPLALLWYLPSLDHPKRLELLVSLVVLVLLAVRGRPLGLAVYAVTPALVVAAGDGSNDTAAGLLILLALLVAVRTPVGGAALLAVAVAFKPYALAWLPGLLAYGGVLWPLLAFALASALAWLPAIVSYGAGPILTSMRDAEGLHPTPYYSLAYALDARDGLPREVWSGLRLVVGFGLGVANLLFVRTAAGLILGGTLVFAATLFLGWWGTFAYLAAVAPVLCWHLDEWLGLGGQRIIWPGDPVQRVTDWADRRWPVRSGAVWSGGRETAASIES